MSNVNCLKGLFYLINNEFNSNKEVIIEKFENINQYQMSQLINKYCKIFHKMWLKDNKINYLDNNNNELIYENKKLDKDLLLNIIDNTSIYTDPIHEGS